LLTPTGTKVVGIGSVAIGTLRLVYDNLVLSLMVISCFRFVSSYMDDYSTGNL